MFKDCKVKAESVADFLDRFYRPDRYRGRGEEYAAVLLASHIRDFEANGYDIISRHDSVTGQVVAFFGDNPCTHPTERLYTWTAFDNTLCAGCCDCGAVLKGAT